MQKGRTLALAFAFAGALATISCGGGGGSAPTSPSPSTGGSGSTNIVTINIKGVNGKLSFDPNPATVNAGQLVVFKNIDVVAHRPTLDDNTSSTGDIAPGATSQPMSIGGNKSYHCGNHPSMVGSFNGNETPEPPPCTGYCG
jgi:plastocyanin